MEIPKRTEHEIGELCRKSFTGDIDWQFAKLRIIDIIKNELYNDSLLIVPIDDDDENKN